MGPILEMSQSLLSFSDSTSFKTSPSPGEEGIRIRPVVFNDFVDALGTLQGRSRLETCFCLL